MLRAAPDDRSPAERLAFGVVNLDKPPGPSSHEVAGWVRDLAGQERAAHAGTLDPKVTGCLPILVGDATRLAQVLADARKEYVTVLELHGPAPETFEAVLAEFEGEIYQRPPRKSAVRRERRVREIHRLDVLERTRRRALLRIECAAGTYVRKLCHDLGLALGTGANMGDLRRTRTGTFDDSTLVSAHDLADALAFWRDDRDGDGDGDAGPLCDVVQPAERVLRGVPRVTIADSAARAVANGAPVYAPGVLSVEPGLDAESGRQVACYTTTGAAVCIGRLVGDPGAASGTVVDLDRVLV